MKSEAFCSCDNLFSNPSNVSMRYKRTHCQPLATLTVASKRLKKSVLYELNNHGGKVPLLTRKGPIPQDSDLGLKFAHTKNSEILNVDAALCENMLNVKCWLQSDFGFHTISISKEQDGLWSPRCIPVLPKAVINRARRTAKLYFIHQSQQS